MITGLTVWADPICANVCTRSVVVGQDQPQQRANVARHAAASNVQPAEQEQEVQAQQSVQETNYTRAAERTRIQPQEQPVSSGEAQVSPEGSAENPHLMPADSGHPEWTTGLPLPPGVDPNFKDRIKKVREGEGAP